MAKRKLSKAEQRAIDMHRRVGALSSFALMIERRGDGWTLGDHVRIAVDVRREVRDSSTGADAAGQALVAGARQGLRAAAAFALAGNPDGAAQSAEWAASARDMLATIPAPRSKASARERGFRHIEATQIAAAAMAIANKSRRDESDNPS